MTVPIAPAPPAVAAFWTRARRLATPSALLAVILIVAAVVRGAGLAAGIPFGIEVDEPQLVNRAVIMMKTGDFNPHFFDYPSLCIYVQLATAIARFLTGAMAGRWGSLDKFTAADAYLWARAVTALFGTLTVALVYRCARVWGEGPALLGAALMAVMPLHVRESHYALTDVPLTFFVTLTLLLSIRANRAPRIRTFVWAGIAAGLAAATKYPGAVSIVMPVAAALMTPDAGRWRVRYAAIAAVTAGLAFLIACPYVVLDLPGFLNGFAHLAGIYAPGGGAPAWLTYLKDLRNALSWPGMVVAAAGLALACVQVVRGPARVAPALAVVFVVSFFWLIARQSGLVFGRYLLPLTPFVSIFVAIAAAKTWPALQRISGRQRRAAAAMALSAVVLGMPAITSAGFDRMVAKTSTQALTYDWLLHHVSPDQLVVVGCEDLVLAYTPFRNQMLRQLRMKTASEYAAEGASYLVASSACYGRYLQDPRVDPDAYREYTQLFDSTDEAATVEPSNDHPGPEYRVLKVRR